jgi:hypothetical protein
MIRDSVQKSAAYVLSYVHESNIHHVNIEGTLNGLKLEGHDMTFFRLFDIVLIVDSFLSVSVLWLPTLRLLLDH